MEKVRLREIISDYDSQALTSILDYWEDYDSETVILAYAELNRRKFDINKRLLINLEVLSHKNNQPDIDTFLNEFLSNFECNSFEKFISRSGLIIGNKYDSKVYNTPTEEDELVGIGGWLKFFIISLFFSIVLNAVLVVLEVISFLEDPTLPGAYVYVLTVLDLIYYGSIIGFLIYTTYSFVKYKMNSVSLGKMFLI